MDLLEMTVAGRHLKTNASQADGPVRTALGALNFGGEGQFQGGAVRTRPAHVTVVEITFKGSRSQFGMLGSVVFHLHPGQGGFVELAESQVSDSFEHRQEPPFDLGPEVLLLPVILGCGLHPIRTKQNSSLRSHTRFIRGGADVLN